MDVDDRERRRRPAGRAADIGVAALRIASAGGRVTFDVGAATHLEGAVRVHVAVCAAQHARVALHRQVAVADDCRPLDRDERHLHGGVRAVGRMAGRLDQHPTVGIDRRLSVLRDPQLVDRSERQPTQGVVLIEQARLVGRPGRAGQCQTGRWPGNAPALETAVVGVGGHCAAQGVRAQQETRDGRRRRGEAVGAPATQEV